MLCIASEYYPVGKSPVDNRTGICRNITSGIHLDILYAETGRSNDYPIYEILGGKVRYILEYLFFCFIRTLNVGVILSLCLCFCSVKNMLEPQFYEYAVSANSLHCI